MHHAKTQDPKHSRVRHRKSGKSPPPSKMVGLGSEELLVSNIADSPMELEISSEDEGEGGGDMQRLIPLPVSTVCIDPRNKKDDLGRNESENAVDDESVWSISIQMFIPFLLAGFGMVAASLLLDVVQVLQIKSFRNYLFNAFFFKSIVRLCSFNRETI